MNRPGVPAQDLESFAAWRRRPGAEDAFAEVAKTWRRTDVLRDHAGVQALVTQALAASRPRKKERPVWIAASALFAGAMIAGVAVLFFTGPSWSTKPGRRGAATLADGSHVLLDADTCLQSRWLSGSRHLWLVRGQALFDVVHDPAHPFVVDAGPSVVVARGTRFDVLRLAGETRVVLLRGAVDVRDRHGEPHARRLRPGQSTRSDAPLPVPADTAADLSWIQGKLIFDHTPIAEAVALMSRHSVAPLRLDPASHSDLTISGVFSTTDTAGFLAALRSLSGATTSSNPQGATDISLSTVRSRS